MRLCMIYSADVRRVGEQYYLNRTYGREVESLLPYVEEVILCNPVAPASSVEGLLPSPPRVSVRPLPYYRRWTESYRIIPLAIPVLQQAIRQSDLIYVRMPSPLGLVSFVLSRLFGKPVVLHIVGDQRQQYEASHYRGVMGGIARFVVEFNEWSTQRMVNRALTIVQGEELVRKHKRNGNRVVNLTRSPISVGDVVERTRPIGDRPLRLVYVGALLEKKGVGDLIQALPTLSLAGVDWRLEIIGSGPQELALQKVVEEAGVGKAVEFLGAILSEEELFRHFRQADVCVVPSRSEGMPRVLLEAMAAGAAVIATRVGGIPGIVREGENGLLVSPGTPSEIAEAILRLTRDPILFERLVRNGRETALLHTRERYAERLFQLLSAHLPLEIKASET